MIRLNGALGHVDQSKDTLVTISNPAECSFYDDAIHIHEIKPIVTVNRLGHVSAFEYFGAWLFCSETTVHIFAPYAQMPSGETEVEYLEEIVQKMRQKVEFKYVDCAYWLNLLVKTDPERLRVSDIPEFSYYMGDQSAIDHFLTVDSKKLKNNNASWEVL